LDRLANLDPRRAAAAGAVFVALVVLVALLVRAGSAYKVHALFPDAGQLVKGDLVEVGGKTVGTVNTISLTSDNQADVLLNITDGQYKPLHRGTIMRIRLVGSSGVTNRYLEMTPGADSAPEIEDGGTLPATSTRTVVDLDILLSSLTPKVRKRLQEVIHEGSQLLDGRTRDANRVLEYLNPALGQTRAVADEIAGDPAAVDRLVTKGAALAGALTSRRADLQEGIGNSAATLRAIAAERASLDNVLARAPGVLRHARTTLGNVTSTLAVVTPALRELQPSAAPLARLLRGLPPTARRATPVLADLRVQLPFAALALRRLPTVARVGLPALRSTASAVLAGLPINRGLRPYAPDLVAGLFKGVAGSTSGSYDANGHFVRIGPYGSAQGGLSGLLSLLPGLPTSALTAYRTGLTARCPGGAAEPAADASNPWIPDPSLCDPEHDHR
jgi:phospholipid/cholesterol/gamma-HCH transport system substrate-binding protein